MSLIADSLKKALKTKESLGPRVPQFNLITPKAKLSVKLPDKKVLGQVAVIGILGIIFSYLVFSGAFDKGNNFTKLPILEYLGLKNKKPQSVQEAKAPLTLQSQTLSSEPVKEIKSVEPFVPPQTVEETKNNTIETSESPIEIEKTIQEQSIAPQTPLQETQTSMKDLEEDSPQEIIPNFKIGSNSEAKSVNKSPPFEITIKRRPKVTAKKYRQNRSSSESRPNLAMKQSSTPDIQNVVILSPKEFLEQISRENGEKLAMANFSPDEMILLKNLDTDPRPKKTKPEIFRDSNYYFNMGTFHQEAGDHQEALINYQKAAELDPKNPEIYNNIGLVYKKLRMYDASLEQFMRALYIKPNFSKAYNNIGVVYYKKGNIKGAILNYKKAILAEPDNLETYNNLGTIYKKQNWLEKAQSVYNKAFKIDPNHPGINYNLGLLYEEMGNMTSAVYFYRRFVKTGGDQHPQLVTRVKNHLATLVG
jgi:tetratricopeptide (TPR) repeat protein